ncbi:hypothetical protein ACFVTT_25485 [Streptomyces niveus]|uniref:hypothetical protein n=1 Tax=Streptomyces niveus TaxID=193462 RepID=UPI0034407F5E
MSPDPGARRSSVIMVEPALTQLAKLTASETHRLDRAIVAISVNPELGAENLDTIVFYFYLMIFGFDFEPIEPDELTEAITGARDLLSRALRTRGGTDRTGETWSGPEDR